MTEFFTLWNRAAVTSIGLFWMAFWAFGLGYLVSSMIQVFVTKERMKNTMGESGPRSVALGTFFGFISSSCSFAALSTTRALFAKGAGLVPSLAFLLASTNLVIELGIVISVFLGWRFVVGEYVGGLLLILLMWPVVRYTLSSELENTAREHAKKSEEVESDDGQAPHWKELILSKEGWAQVASKYLMEWSMVWKDVTIGFTVAGIIAAFVPRSFFEALFFGSGGESLSFFEVLLQALVGPVAAFFTFIGSMGNIPLAAVLFSNGVSFAGVMAFIFSDLVVFPVLRIHAEYYGWKMAFYILGVFLFILIATALLLHFGFFALDLLPDSDSAKSVVKREFFQIDLSFFLNVLFVLLSLIAFWWKGSFSLMENLQEAGAKDTVLILLSGVAFFWLIGGLLVGAA